MRTAASLRSAGPVVQRTNDAPILPALQIGATTAIKDSSSEFPEHAKEADAKQTLRDTTEGPDIVDLIAEKKIEIETQGSGIDAVSVRVRKLVPDPLTVRIPVGTFFVSASQSSQNMVTTAESKVRLTSDEWQSMSPSTACANRPRHIPSGNDSFSVQRSPNQKELARLMPILDKANVDYATSQAAVWIVTDNATYDDLGILVASSNGSDGSRVIHEAEAARAMQICELAGINIKRKAIWGDRKIILSGLDDGELRKWLYSSSPENSVGKNSVVFWHAMPKAKDGSLVAIDGVEQDATKEGSIREC